jgi:hypothetical protein
MGEPFGKHELENVKKGKALIDKSAPSAPTDGMVGLDLGRYYSGRERLSF